VVSLENCVSLSILALNAGSSSLKFRLFRAGDEAALANPSTARAATTAEGAARFDQGSGSLVWCDAAGVKHTVPGCRDHGAAARAILDALRGAELVQDGARLVTAHRVVHGGSLHVQPVLVDAQLLADLRQLRELAPLHNARACDVLEAVTSVLGARVANVAVFDTAFHATLPPHAAQYAIELELAEKHGIRRFGFHGLAHRWMSERVARLSPRAAHPGRVVTLQLGNGCSAAAIERSRSVDVTMGFTPLEGLMMGTRSGDVDPALVPFLAERENVDAHTVERWLETRSGLLGVSGVSSDVRAVLAAEARGDERAHLAIEMFCYRARKSIGALQAALGGLDAIVFGGGLGENAPEGRARILAPLAGCGVDFDSGTNAHGALPERRITRDRSAIEAWVVHVEEEVLLARDALRVIEGRSPDGLSHEPPGMRHDRVPLS
jgi:acetate kinase